MSTNFNESIYETVTAFDPQLPIGNDFAGDRATTPVGVEYLKDGKAVLRFFAPTANTVTVRLGHLEGRELALKKGSDGVFETIISPDLFERVGDKYCAIFFLIDGVYVLNPMASIGFSHSHPINFIDLPGEDFYHIKDVPHGNLARDYYYSKTCNCYKSCLVYTPPGYARGDYDALPILYLQHGYGENETSWAHLGKVNFIMDNLLAQGKARPCIIVMNNGMTQTANNNGNRNLKPQNIENLLLSDCIPYIEDNYRAYKDKWHRAMAGLSMGSMQTSVITLKHPESFGYVGIFSGFLGKLGKLKDQGNEHFSAFDDKPKLYESYKLFFRCIGDEDNFIDTYNEESAMLKAKGVTDGDWGAYVEKIYKGYGHDWNVWRVCVRDFLTRVFK